MKKLYIFSLISGIFLSGITDIDAQGVGIGPSSFTPNTSAGLHVNFSDKGLLLPQVDLFTSLTTLEAGAHGLILYNTNSGALEGTGLYLNTSPTSTPEWHRLSAGGTSGTGAEGRLAYWSTASSLGNCGDLFWDTLNNRLGIGTTSPEEQVTLTRNLMIPASTDTTGIIYKSGGYHYIHDFGMLNNFFGSNAGNLYLEGTSNNGVGDDVLSQLTNGGHNTAMGDYAMNGNSTGSLNTAMGSTSLSINSSGNGNVAIGFSSLSANTEGEYNTAIGTQALNYNESGSNNTAVGYGAGTTTGLVLSNTLALGSGAVAGASDEIRLGNGTMTTLYCPAVYASTSANAANVFIDADGRLCRSTAKSQSAKDLGDTLRSHEQRIAELENKLEQALSHIQALEQKLSSDQ